MEIFLLIVIVGLAVRWYLLRNRLRDLERRIELLAANQAQARELTGRVHRLEQSFTRLLPPASPRPETPPALPARTAELALPPAEAEANAPVRVPPPLPVPPPFPPPRVAVPSFDPRFTASTEPAWHRPLGSTLRSSEWESIASASTLKKAAALVLLIGTALLLTYVFGSITPSGRAGMALAASAALLSSGIRIENRTRYRLCARVLTGGGWIGLYASAYAIYTLPAVRIVHDPAAGSLGPLVVGLGMIAHSLRYRARAVTAVAYLAAYVALTTTSYTPLALVGLVPLAGSLLYFAISAEWYFTGLFGLVATYAICIARGSLAAPLASAQALLLAYWLLFEAFDLIRVRKRIVSGGVEWIAPLNAAAGISLSYILWSHKAPNLVWLISASSAALYLASAMARISMRPPSSFRPGSELPIRLRLGSYEGSLGVAAILAAFAIFRRLPGVWASGGLALEAEMLYLAGVRFRAPYLRRSGATAFAFSLACLALPDVRSGQSQFFGHITSTWTPPALFQALLFYINRVLRRPNMVFSSVAAGLLAAILAAAAPTQYLGASWLVLALLLLQLGLHTERLEFRVQAYALATAGLLVTGYMYTASGSPLPWPGLAIAVAAVYLFALHSRWHGGVLEAFEDGSLAMAASGATAILACLLIWTTVPVTYAGLAWCLLALALFEAGNLGLPLEMRLMSWPVAALGAEAVVLMHRGSFAKFAAPDVWVSYLAAGLAAWAAVARAVVRPPANLAAGERTAVPNILGAAGAVAAMAFAWLVLPDPLVSLAWAVLGAAALEMGLLASVAAFRWTGDAVLAAALVRALAVDMNHAEPWKGLPERLLAVVSAILALYWLVYRNRVYTRFRDLVRRYLVTVRGPGGSPDIGDPFD